MRLAASALLVFAACTVGEDGQKAGDGLSDQDKGGNPSTDGITAEARICASGATTKGVDVSYYEENINWSALKAGGIDYAFIRLSDGTTFQDPKFSTYWQAAKAAGVIRGAYQFFRPAQSATAQADMMIAAIGTYTPGDLPPVIDVEVTGGLSAATVASRVRTWVDRVHNALGVNPIVYTGYYFWRDSVGNPTGFSANALWIAAYVSHCPDIPTGWSKWMFWQTSDKGHVAGISGEVDVDTFNGSRDDLLAFAGGMMEPPPPDSCASATMNTDLPTGTCVQAASDGDWYRCDSGSWTSIPSSSGCATAYAWCSSATLGRAVPPRSCVQAASDDMWYQCDGHSWVQPVDTASYTGPAGLCSETHQL